MVLVTVPSAFLVLSVMSFLTAHETEGFAKFYCHALFLICFWIGCAVVIVETGSLYAQ